MSARNARMPRPGLLFAAIVTLPALCSAADQPGATASVIERYHLEEGATRSAERPGWRKPKRILVGGFAAPLTEALQRAAPDVEFVVATPANAARKAVNVDATIGICTPEVLAAGKSIRWVQLVSAGVEHCVTIPAIRERGILVRNMPATFFMG